MNQKRKEIKIMSSKQKLDLLPNLSLTLEEDYSITYAEDTFQLNAKPTNVNNNPLLLLGQFNPLLQDLGVITTDIGTTIRNNIIEDVIADESWFHDQLLLQQKEPYKLIIKHPKSNCLVGLNLIEDGDLKDLLFDVIFLVPYQAPKIYNKVSYKSVGQVWSKVKKDFLAEISKEFNPQPEESAPEVVVVDTVTPEAPFKHSLTELVDCLGSFVLQPEDLDTLKDEIAKEQEKYDHPLVLKKFLAYESYAGDEIVSVQIRDPKDTTGSSVEFVHGDSHHVHGPKGWYIVDHFATGTDIESEERYV